MKLPTGSNSARLMLWVAISALPLAAWVGMAQRIPAIAQDAAPTFKIPAELPKGASISIDSDASMAAVSASLKKQFNSKFADAAVTVAANGSDAALESLSAGKVDVAATGRPLSEAEKAKGLTGLVLEREKIAVFVAEENAFKGDIGFTQFAKIFRGEVTDWSQVGGAAGAIRFIDRPDSSDTRKSLSFYPVFAGTPFAAGATAQAVNEDNTALVVKNLGTDGIGYAPYNQVKDMPGIRILAMHKVLPNDAAYPYSQPRVLAYKGEPTPAVQAFLAVATDSAGQTAINQVEAAEAAALAAGENPLGEKVLAQAGAGADAAQQAAGDGVDAAAAAAGDAANVAGDAANKAVDAAGNGAGAAGEAAGNVAGAAGEAVGAAGEAAGNVAGAAGEAAGAAGDAVGNAAGAAGDAVADLPGAGVLKGRGLSPLWGVLPLAAIAAGGGLLWWLAAGKDDDNFGESDDSRELVAAGSDLRGQAGELGAGAAGLGAAGLGAAGGALGQAQDAVGVAVDGVKGGVSGIGQGIQGGVSGVGDGIRGGVDGLTGGVTGLGDGLQSGVSGAVDGAKGMGSNISGAAAAAGGTIDGAAKKGGGFFSGLFGKAKDAAETATDAAGAGLKGAGDLATDAVDGVTGTVGGVANKLSEGAGNVASGLKDGVADAADGVKGGAAELKNAAGDAVEAAKTPVDDWSNDV